MECDIIIPVWNQLAFTRDCIDSITKNTKGVEYSVIIVDNASDADTRRYLEGLKSSAEPPITVIRNEENLGFIKAVNEGIRASRAPYVCILNNDTVTTGGWLSEMIKIASSSADIGIVNPSSNNLGQKPADGEPLEQYAEKMRREAGTYIELGSAIGFCMLIKRRLFDIAGLFDEIYGMGNFEDTDFSRKAVKADFRLVRACGAYVYHRESSSFSKLKTFDEEFERNREIFEFRWGRPKRIAYILDEYDENGLAKMRPEAVKLARAGNWVYFFLKETLELPHHSNIILVKYDPRSFYLNTAFRVLKKKKHFDEIFLGGEIFGKVLERLSFIHKAKISYY